MRVRENWFGAWAYTIGVILAVIIGLIVGLNIDVPNYNTLSTYATLILVILGLVIGFMNVGGKDSNTFMLSGAILVIVSNFGLSAIEDGILVVGVLGRAIFTIFNSLQLLFVPATIIVALKALFSISRV